MQAGVAQTFLSASPRDWQAELRLPVPCFKHWRLAAVAPERRFGAPQRRKSRQNSQAGKPALPRPWNSTPDFGLNETGNALWHRLINPQWDIILNLCFFHAPA